MAHPDAQRWNEIYERDGDQWRVGHPRQLLLDFAPYLPHSGLALDAAAGVGKHGLFLAERGLHVIALDVSETGLRLAQKQAWAQGVLFETAVTDLTHLWLPSDTFDVILNFRFLERVTFGVYQQALKPGGWLLFETFVQWDTAVSHPHHYLEPGELAGAFANLEQIYYEETAVDQCKKPRQKCIARFVGRKG
ncbi:MAG: class I SAM-dependent methyltransferase [Chloroflexi bacterium]|nr:class I SAM-dependent methyltransferase [Chloroflexota bacterium]